MDPDKLVLSASFLVLVSNAVFAFAILFFVVRNLTKSTKSYWSAFVAFVAKYWLQLVFVVTLFSSLVSLFLSEIVQLPPCKLCWFQRSLMYPLPFIFGTALIGKKRDSQWYGLVLSVIGLLVAGYQYYLQIFLSSSVPCSTGVFEVSCSQIYVMNYGYITIPWMAFSGFLYVFAMVILKLISDKKLI